MLHNNPPPQYCHMLIKNSQGLGLLSFLITSQNIKFNQSSHATSKKGKCKDGLVPTCMLDNRTAIMFSHMLTPPPQLHTAVLGCQKVGRYRLKLCLCQRTLFCFTINIASTRKCGFSLFFEKLYLPLWNIL